MTVLRADPAGLLQPENRPTKMVTCEPPGMLEPACGCSSMTSPSLLWFVVGRLSTITRNPAERKVPAAVVVPTVVAVVVVVPTVVVEGPAPVETFSVTFEPLSTSFPAAGFCATTTPAGFVEGTLCNAGFRPTPVKAVTAAPCDWPTTCGTTTGLAPLETFRFTVVPRTAVTPATGDCSTTTPFGRDDATRLTALVNPADVSFCCASASGSDVTSGTARRPLEIEITTDCPCRNWVPAPGLWAKTTSGGRSLCPGRGA